MSRGPDAATLLERALAQSAERAGCAVAVVDSDWDRWASATFVGARHVMTLTGEDSDRLTAWLSGLAEADLPIRGHLVADVKVMRVERRDGRATARIEALTVEAR